MKKVIALFVLILSTALFADTTESDKKRTNQAKVGQRILEIQMSDYTAIDLLAELNYPTYTSVQDGRFRHVFIKKAELYNQKFSIQLKFYGNMILLFKIWFEDDYDENGKQMVWTYTREKTKVKTKEL
ncbi:MAG: hypothetical protein SVR08_16035 [Spirochaetota bacterium]|nr:hypothetical protein [Spirochaetota bacterium]